MMITLDILYLFISYIAIKIYLWNNLNNQMILLTLKLKINTKRSTSITLKTLPSTYHKKGHKKRSKCYGLQISQIKMKKDSKRNQTHI